MTSKVRRVDFYPDEYIAGVGCQMSAEMQGVFWMICALINSNGGEIDNDPKHIGRLVCVTSGKAKRMIDELANSGKIIKNGSKISQKRAENEVKLARKRIKNSKKNGQKGGRPPNKNKDLENPEVPDAEKLTTNYQPPTTNHIDKEDTNVSPKNDMPEKKPPKKAARIPGGKDWQPDETDIKHAHEKGYRDEQINLLADAFRDHWIAAPGKGSTALDWNAKWRTWTANDIKFNGNPDDQRNQKNSARNNGRGSGSITKAFADISSFRRGEDVGLQGPGKDWPDFGSGEIIDG